MWDFNIKLVHKFQFLQPCHLNKTQKNLKMIHMMHIIMTYSLEICQELIQDIFKVICTLLKKTVCKNPRMNKNNTDFVNNDASFKHIII